MSQFSNNVRAMSGVALYSYEVFSRQLVFRFPVRCRLVISHLKTLDQLWRKCLAISDTMFAYSEQWLEDKRQEIQSVKYNFGQTNGASDVTWHQITQFSPFERYEEVWAAFDFGIVVRSLAPSDPSFATLNARAYPNTSKVEHIAMFFLHYFHIKSRT
jgi:hypothetical protein